MGEFRTQLCGLPTCYEVSSLLHCVSVIRCLAYSKAQGQLTVNQDSD